jgi:hypothetical protein
VSAIRCRRRYCGLWMTPTTDGQGRVTFVCAGCARNKHGLCRECPKSLADCHAMRCPSCAKRRDLAISRERDRARYPIRRGNVLAHHRARQAIPTIREHRRRYMEAYRASHPRDGLDRAYTRAYMQKRRADPWYRAKQNARKRELRALARAA